jgi:dTDP-4-dehydrorhamnose 3,5-epimerase
MATNSLQIEGCWVFKPNVFADERGTFFEWFQDSAFESETGYRFEIAQANISISDKGVIRGIHCARVPPGQAKYVTCISGSVFDVVVDLRKSSATFGQWDSILLDSRNPKALYIPSGIGHAFMALEDNSTFVYLCGHRYNPKNEFD